MPRRTDTRQRILEAAVSLFAERGIEATSMRDIAAAVGITEGAVYRHFTGKGELVGEIFATNYQALGAEMRKRSDGAATLRGKVAAMVRACCELYDANEAVFRVLLLSQHREIPRLPQDATTPIGIVRDAIEQGIARQEIPTRDPRLLTAYFFGLLAKPAEIPLYGGSARSMSALSEDIGDAIWTVLAREAA